MNEPKGIGLELDLGPNVNQFRTELRQWLTSNVPESDLAADEATNYEIRRGWQQTLFAAGWAGVSWPEEYGGTGSGPLQQFVYYEEMARAGAPEPVNQPGLILFGPTLMIYGSEALKRRYLPRMLSAEDIWCQGFSEPEAGSDLSAVRTRAELDGDQFVVSGQKIWTSFANYAKKCALLCRTTQTNQDRPHDGLTMLILDLDQPGVEVAPIRQITGDSLEFGQLFIDEAKVPVDQIAGSIGGGWQFAMKMLEFERSDLGLHNHAALEKRLVAVAKFIQNSVDRGAMSKFDAISIRQKLADAWVRCGLLRQFNVAVAYGLERGEMPGSQASLIRLYWSELSQAVGDLEYECLGPDAPVDAEFTHDYLHSLHTTIASGTQQIQLNIVAQRYLGLPR